MKSKITLALVAQVREATGCGVHAARLALKKTSGDVALAVSGLRHGWPSPVPEVKNYVVLSDFGEWADSVVLATEDLEEAKALVDKIKRCGGCCTLFAEVLGE